MLLGDLTAADVILPAGADRIDIQGLSADSRAVERGFLFAALRGAAADGARFAAEAVGRGAVAVLAGTGSPVAVDAGVPVIRSDDPRRALSLMAARFFPRQPEHMVAVTGTSGKTSVAAFVRQIFAAAGKHSASVGTLGVVTDKGTDYGNLTTPDPVALHRMLDRLAGEGITHAAVEASSHGLDQRRLDGLRIKAAAFTNLGRDHLDYHRTVEDYLEAKLRLFAAILPADGTAVIDMDDAHAARVAAIAAGRGQTIVRVGFAGREIRLVERVAEDFGQRLEVESLGRSLSMRLPLVGAFQAANALVAMGLATAAGIDTEVVADALTRLEGAPGRLELVGRKANGAMIFVDYAHKPDALVSALAALRPLTARRLIVVFGAGGDRDHGKRPMMGKAAADNADIVIVTDDNPRSEEPAAIRKAIIAGASHAIEIGDRAEAIRRAIDMLDTGDVLCVAGKGHETGQIVGTATLPFSDHQVVRKVLDAEEAA
jgi:UDP-N-acetylmuramoyl-L-alanyl-D-glutamate--2,6-diaminopimelate ligase